MSALAYAALARASQGSNPASMLFVDMHNQRFSGDVRIVESDGYSQYGIGGALYITDSLATAKLVADHPRFAFTDAGGRHFRLHAADGWLSVEQGGAKGSAAVNDQPAIQAAIDYAGAAGIERLRFTRDYYQLWAPQRSSPASAIHASDGHYLTIRHTLTMEGTAATRSVLDCRSTTGRTLDDNWQDVGGTVWRGNGVSVIGDVADSTPDELAIERVGLERLVFRGNATNTGNYVYPPDPVSGDGWDPSHKGFRVQDTHVGDIVITDTDFIGWRGEMFYVVGYAPRSITAERCQMLTGNANAWNVQVSCPTLVVDCEFGDCCQAAEAISQGQATYRNVTFRDCQRIWMIGGRDKQPGYHYRWPTRDASGPMPVCTLEDCTLRSVEQALIGSFVHGSLTTVDSLVLLDCNNLYAIEDCHLSIDAWLDLKTGVSPLAISGPSSLETAVPSSPPGTFEQPVRHTHISLSCRRTSEAAANDRQWFAPQWAGLIEPNCSVTIRHAELPIDNPMRNFENPPQSFPLMRHEDVVTTQFYGGTLAMWHGSVGASGVFVPRAVRCATAVDDETTHDLHLPTAPAAGSGFGYVEGQRIRIYKRTDPGALRFVKGAHPSFVVPQTRVLDNGQGWIEFEWNPHANRWEESAFRSSSAT